MARKEANVLTPEEQQELNEIQLSLMENASEAAEVQEAPSAAKAPESGEGTKYVVPAGQEKYVHLKIHKGHRYDPETGKEVSPSYVQTFNYSEWQVLKDAFPRMDITIEEVLHDPYGDAQALKDEQDKAKSEKK